MEPIAHVQQQLKQAVDTLISLWPLGVTLVTAAGGAFVLKLVSFK